MSALRSAVRIRNRNFPEGVSPTLWDPEACADSPVTMSTARRHETTRSMLSSSDRPTPSTHPESAAPILDRSPMRLARYPRADERATPAMHVARRSKASTTGSLVRSIPRRRSLEGYDLAHGFALVQQVEASVDVVQRDHATLE